MTSLSLIQMSRCGRSRVVWGNPVLVPAPRTHFRGFLSLALNWCKALSVPFAVWLRVVDRRFVCSRLGRVVVHLYLPASTTAAASATSISSTAALASAASVGRVWLISRVLPLPGVLCCLHLIPQRPQVNACVCFMLYFVSRLDVGPCLRAEPALYMYSLVGLQVSHMS